MHEVGTRSYPRIAAASGAVLSSPYTGTVSPWSFELVPAPSAAGAAVKRTMDVCLALVALLLVAPILALAAVLIRLTSRGPVLFTQPRVGLNGEEFMMYKLRTMVRGADSLETDFARGEAGAFLKVRDDPRVTRIGRVLRKLSVDELPQLENVLRGEMSLVGPRPLLRCDVEKLWPEARRRRFSVKPGMTGLWQVSGRTACSDEERVRLDHEYVERWSLWLDLEILARTLPAVLSTRGAA